MSKILYEKTCSVTQSVEAVVELLKFLGRSYDPLPEAVQLPGMVLVLSNKRDVFYTTSATDCSCPAKTWRPGQSCKHQRRFFPRTNDTLARATAGEDAISIRPMAKWVGGHNGPVEVD